LIKSMKKRKGIDALIWQPEKTGKTQDGELRRDEKGNSLRRGNRPGSGREKGKPHTNCHGGQKKEEVGKKETKTTPNTIEQPCRGESWQKRRFLRTGEKSGQTVKRGFLGRIEMYAREEPPARSRFKDGIQREDSIWEGGKEEVSWTEEQKE